MSVALSPSSSLGFHRPLAKQISRTLTVNNPNAQTVAFKVKTTAPKLYCVRPNSGKVEPGKSVDIQVILQGLKEEPPINAKCKDKFLIQSTIITPEKEPLSLQDIWNVPDTSEEGKVYQQKLKVVFLPPEGQNIPEEDEGPHVDLDHDHPSTLIANGHTEPQYGAEHSVNVAPTRDDSLPLTEPLTPPAHFSVARDEPHDDSDLYPEPPIDPFVFPSNVHPQLVPPADEVSQDVTPMAESSPKPTRVPIPVEAETRSSEELQAREELAAKLKNALAEIDRLRAILASAPDPTSPTSTELQRREKKALSDDGSTVAGTEVGTVFIDDHALQPEGVPLQVVLIIALGVFITTYLFF